MSIEFKDVSFTYWQAESPALQDISVQIPVGQFVVLTGPTGAGKSTFLQMLNGLIPNLIPGNLVGDILVNGVNTRQAAVSELSRQVGLVFEDPDTQIVSLTVEDDIAFGPSNLGWSSDEIRASIHEALIKTRLLGFENRNPFNLSGGEKQSLAMAGVLAMRPGILALDEPTSMLDPVGRTRIISILKTLASETNTTILVVEQNPELIMEMADRVMLFDNGRIIRDGSPREVFCDVETLRRVGAKLPPIVEVFWELGRLVNEPFELLLTVEEAFAWLKPRLKPGWSPSRQFRVSSPGSNHSLAVEVHDCDHDYGDGVFALKKINVNFQRRGTTAIIGQNGSGKSTLAFHLVGIYHPTNPEGKVLVDGLDVKATPLKELIRHVNYVFQNPDDQLFQESIKDEIEYGLKNLGIPADERKKRLDWALNCFNLQDYADQPPKSLSRGLRTKTAIAAILSMQPSILVVDEPTTGLDRQESLEIMQVLLNLADDGTTVIFITHEMDLVAQFAGRAVVMHAGKVLMDAPVADVFSAADILQQASLSLPDIHRLSLLLGWEDFVDLHTPADLAAMLAKGLETK